MSQPENISDRELDDLLREVEVPVDLRQRLMRVPNMDQATVAEFHASDENLGSQSGDPLIRTAATLPNHERNGKANSRKVILRWGLGVAIAATLIGVLLSIPNQPGAGDEGVAARAGDEGSAVSSEAPTTNEPADETRGPKDVPAVDDPSPRGLTGRFDVAGVDVIGDSLLELENQRLERQLIELRRKSSISLMSDTEFNSLVLAISDQSTIGLGGSGRHVKNDMEFVRVNFPQTKGAKIASDYLEALSANESPVEFSKD